MQPGDPLPGLWGGGWQTGALKGEIPSYRLRMGLQTLTSIAGSFVEVPSFHICDPCREGQGVCWCLDSKAKGHPVTL